MRPQPVRRVVVVILDGLRADAIDEFEMRHWHRMASRGLDIRHATTVSPSITTSALTSLMTGVEPGQHAVASDKFHIPLRMKGLEPLPALLGRHGHPTLAFLGEVPRLYRGLLGPITRRLGIAHASASGRNAPEIALSAVGALRNMPNGMIVLHLPDADRAGHSSGWMTPEYGGAVQRLDETLGLIAAMASAHQDDTLLIALADHGGGGADLRDHESEHPADKTIPILVAGGAVSASRHQDPASILDIAPTIAAAMGIASPASWAGRPLLFERAEEVALPLQVAAFA